MLDSTHPEKESHSLLCTNYHSCLKELIAGIFFLKKNMLHSFKWSCSNTVNLWKCLQSVNHVTISIEPFFKKKLSIFRYVQGEEVGIQDFSHLLLMVSLVLSSTSFLKKSTNHWNINQLEVLVHKELSWKMYWFFISSSTGPSLYIGKG